MNNAEQVKLLETLCKKLGIDESVLEQQKDVFLLKALHEIILRIEKLESDK